MAMHKQPLTFTSTLKCMLSSPSSTRAHIAVEGVVIGRDLCREIKSRENLVRTDFRKIRENLDPRKFPAIRYTM